MRCTPLPACVLVKDSFYCLLQISLLSTRASPFRLVVATTSLIDLSSRSGPLGVDHADKAMRCDRMPSWPAKKHPCLSVLFHDRSASCYGGEMRRNESAPPKFSAVLGKPHTGGCCAPLLPAGSWCCSSTRRSCIILLMTCVGRPGQL